MTDRDLIRLAVNFSLDLTRAFAANFAAPSTERKELDRVAEPLVVRLVTALDSALPLDGVQVLDLVNGFAVTVLHIMHEAEQLALGRQEKYRSTLATVTTDFQQRLERLAATAPESKELT